MSSPRPTVPHANGSCSRWPTPIGVVPLSNLPVVVTPQDDHIDGWVYAEERPPATERQPNPPKASGPAMDWYLDPYAVGGSARHLGTAELAPDRSRGRRDAPAVPVAPVEVSDIVQDEDSISFKVVLDRFAGARQDLLLPELERSGAEGPYRVSPNFMVVVPTDTEVTPDLRPLGHRLAGLAADLRWASGSPSCSPAPTQRRRVAEAAAAPRGGVDGAEYPRGGGSAR